MARRALKGGGKAAERAKGVRPERPRPGRPRTVAALVTLSSRLFARALHLRLVPHGVAPGQLAVLQRLWQGDGLTQAELARAVRVEQPTMARTLDRMARDGLIERVPSKADRRAFNVRLTLHGRALRRAVESEAAALERAALAELKRGEGQVLARALERVAASLGKTVGSGER